MCVTFCTLEPMGLTNTLPNEWTHEKHTESHVTVAPPRQSINRFPPTPSLSENLSNLTSADHSRKEVSAITTIVRHNIGGERLCTRAQCKAPTSGRVAVCLVTTMGAAKIPLSKSNVVLLGECVQAVCTVLNHSMLRPPEKSQFRQCRAHAQRDDDDFGPRDCSCNAPKMTTRHTTTLALVRDDPKKWSLGMALIFSQWNQYPGRPQNKEVRFSDPLTTPYTWSQESRNKPTSYPPS